MLFFKNSDEIANSPSLPIIISLSLSMSSSLQSFRLDLLWPGNPEKKNLNVKDWQIFTVYFVTNDLNITEVSFLILMIKLIIISNLWFS